MKITNQSRNKTRYDYNLTIMKSPKPATLHCDKLVAILKMETSRNLSMSGIHSGHHNLPTYEILLKSNNVEFVRYCGVHFENGDR
jgi:hypothetical protein